MKYTNKVRNYVNLILGADTDVLHREIELLWTKVCQGIELGLDITEYKQAIKLIRWELVNR
jgi:hypothetical protein